MTRATSRKTGMEMTKPVNSIAQEARSTPKCLTKEVAKDWVPPECSKIAPKIAPMPMIVAMNPKAPPMLLTIVDATCVSGTASGLTNFDTAATTTETTINDRKACSFKAQDEHEQERDAQR